MLIPPYLHRVNAAEKAIDIQTPLHNRFSNSRPTITFAPMVQIATSSHANIKSTSTFLCQSKTLCLRNLRGHILLQQASPSTARIQSPNPRVNNQNKHLGSTWRRSMTPCTRTWPLHKVCVPKTKAVRIATSVKFYPNESKIPKLTK